MTSTSIARSHYASSSAPSITQKFIPSQRMGEQIVRHLTCAVSGDKFPASERRTLEKRQIMEVARHLRDRNVVVKGFDRKVFVDEPTSGANAHMQVISSWRVCVLKRCIGRS
jgi:hypothetical protein